MAILTRLSAIAKFVCKAACAPSLYVAYCLLGAPRRGRRGQWGHRLIRYEHLCYVSMLCVYVTFLCYVSMLCIVMFLYYVSMLCFYVVYLLCSYIFHLFLGHFVGVDKVDGVSRQLLALCTIVTFESVVHRWLSLCETGQGGWKRREKNV